MSKLPKIFIAYAREDAPLLDKLRKPLNVLKRNGHCEIFFDGEIVPGEHWDERLKAELHQADIYLLLVTDNFLDSDYINDVELPKALGKEKEGKAKVVPIIMKHCMWQYTLLKEFQVVMHEGKPIEPADGYVCAVEQVVLSIENLRSEWEAQNKTLYKYSPNFDASVASKLFSDWHIIKLDAKKHKFFLEQKRMDVLTQEHFEVGDLVVACGGMNGNCGCVHLSDSWNDMEGQCLNCGTIGETLIEIGQSQ